MAVVMCGERFSGRVEQEALLKILEFTQSEQARPLGTAIATLQQAWAWPELDL
jgi:hypothetical protein